MSARIDAARAVRFDEHMTGYALAEDEDFSYRLSRLGRIRYVADIVVEHRKLGFGSADDRRFGCLVVVNRAYLFRKNFEQTPLARAQFGLLVAMLVGHRRRQPRVARCAGAARGRVSGLAEAELSGDAVREQVHVAAAPVQLGSPDRLARKRLARPSNRGALVPGVVDPAAQAPVEPLLTDSSRSKARYAGIRRAATLAGKWR